MTLPGSPLSAADLAQLAKCGISAELAERAKLRRVASLEGGQLIGRNGSGDYSGVIFPYFMPGEDRIREVRLRRDKPPLEAKPDGTWKEKEKYLSPPGRSNMAYFMPGTDAGWLADVTIPATITEGEKKTIALSGLAWYGLSESAERPRWLSIGLSGVWNFQGKTGHAPGPNGERRDIQGVIPDIESVVWKGRRVTILYDANIRTNESVQAARWKLTAELQKRGAQVFWFSWPKDTPAHINGIDDLIGALGADKVLAALHKQVRPCKVSDNERKSASREFSEIAEDRYRLELPSLGIAFEIDRLRRDHHELMGELSVRCDLPGARTVDGTLSIADFNLSSARARTERAKLLAERANTRDLDWSALLEEFCQRVLHADRNGQPAVDLRTLPRPEANDNVSVEGFSFPRRHPTIIFGDGGDAKSYTGLYLAGRMAQAGMRVALFDWELAGEDHRDRLERLFAEHMPLITYARCERPLVHEADRLRRIVRDNNIEFAVFDSIAFACDGPPEAAEVAGRYFRAVRAIGIGSLHIAHVSKAEGADQKPFGSAFWHNGARSTWFAKKAKESTEGSTEILDVGFYNRKANLARLQAPLAFTIKFTGEHTIFHPSEAADNPDLAGQLTVRQRMAYLLKRGAMTPQAIAEEIQAEVETVTRTARRHKNLFTVLDGGRLALLERTAS